MLKIENKKDLVRKYLRNELNEKELAKFSEIFCEAISIHEFEEAIEAEKEWMESRSSDDQHRFLEVYSKLLQHINQEKPKSRIFVKLGWACAVFAISILAYIFLIPSPSTSKEKVRQIVETNAGTIKHFRLSDASEIWVNNRTKLRYDSATFSNDRKVYLEGQAYFKIEKDKTRPFVVYLSNFQIQVLGTSFDVKSYKDEAESVVSLNTGKIEIKGIGRASIILIPGQQFIYNKNTKQSFIRQVDVANYIAWRTGQFFYQQVTFATIAKAVERWYDVEMVIEEKSKRDVKLTLNQRDNGLKEVLDVLSFITGLKYKQEGRVITFYE